MTDYTKILLDKHTVLAEEFYNLLLETANDESDYLLACLENNIILEADDSTSGTSGKKVGWFRKLIEVVKSLFAKFVEKGNGLIEKNEKWLKDNTSALQGMNYDGLKVKVQKYTDQSLKIMLDTAGKTEQMIDLKHGENDTLQSKEDVENFGEFKNIKIKDKNFAESCKIRFYGGTTEIPDPVVIGDNELKSYVGLILPYVSTYKNNIKAIQDTINRFETKIKTIENELKRRGVSLESFCLLENCAFEDTDLRYCYNFDIVKEDAQSSNNDNKEEHKETDDKDLKVNNVVDTKVETGKNSELKYIRWAIQLHQVVLTTSMSVMESYYLSSMQILRDIVRTRGK